MDDAENDRSTLMAAKDRLNARYGRGSVASGGTTGEGRQWVMRQE